MQAFRTEFLIRNAYIRKPQNILSNKGSVYDQGLEIMIIIIIKKTVLIKALTTEVFKRYNKQKIKDKQLHIKQFFFHK